MAKAKMDLSSFVGKLLEEQDGDTLQDPLKLRHRRRPRRRPAQAPIHKALVAKLLHPLSQPPETPGCDPQNLGRSEPAVLRLTVRNLAVDWVDDVPAFFTHAIEAESFRELVVDGFRGRQAQKTGAAIRLVGGEDVVVRDSRAAAGTDTFVEATDVTGRTVFAGNDVRAARQPVVPSSFAGPGFAGPGRGEGARNR